MGWGMVIFGTRMPALEPRPSVSFGKTEVVYVPSNTSGESLPSGSESQGDRRFSDGASYEGVGLCEIELSGSRYKRVERIDVKRMFRMVTPCARMSLPNSLSPTASSLWQRRTK